MSGYAKIILIAAVMAIVAATPSSAQIPSTRTGAPFIMAKSSPTVSSLMQQMQADNSLLAQSPKEGDKPPSFDIRSGKKQTATQVTTGKKSPIKAFVLSAIIPGAGQLYTGSKVKAALFFGLEALAWTGNRYYHNRGDQKTNDFNIFARTYWSVARYDSFLVRNHLDDPDSATVFGHHLPSNPEDQQYYEMIGKYNQFVFGWDDVDTVATPYSPRTNVDKAYSAHRLHYEDMRHFANSQYNYARAFLIAAMVNHLVAGAEAALSASRHNRQAEELTNRVTINAYAARSDFGYFPMITMTCRF